MENITTSFGFIAERSSLLWMLFGHQTPNNNLSMFCRFDFVMMQVSIHVEWIFNVNICHISHNRVMAYNSLEKATQ